MEQKRKLLVDIAKLYYEQGLTQAEIAQRYDISRTIVSRKLAEAREAGVVKIFIDSEEDTVHDLERRMLATFSLSGLKIASVPDDNSGLSVKITAKAGAEYLSGFLKEGDRLGVSWGWTLYEFSTALAEQEVSLDMVCQITGSVDNAMVRGYANEIVGNLSRKWNAKEAYAFPCPVIVDSPIISDTLRHDFKIRRVLESGARCNKLLINIALPDAGSCLYQAGYITDADLVRLKENRAVGSICCRFFDESGRPCDETLDGRTLGISNSEIARRLRDGLYHRPAEGPGDLQRPSERTDRYFGHRLADRRRDHAHCRGGTKRVTDTCALPAPLVLKNSCALPAQEFFLFFVVSPHSASLPQHTR